MRYFKYILYIVVYSLYSSSASAYNVYINCGQSGGYTVTWNSPTIDFNVRKIHFPNHQFQSINDAANEFEKVVGSNVKVNTSYTNVSSFFFGNGVNEMYKVWIDWVPGRAGFAKYSYASGDTNNCSGVTGSGHFVEGDVWINPARSYTSNDLEAFTGTPSKTHIGRLAMHEFGHLTGHVGRNITATGAGSGQTYLSHEGDLVTTMNSGGGQFGNVLGANALGLGVYRNKLHADDAAYLRLLYSDNTQAYDVSGSRWKDNDPIPGMPATSNGISQSINVGTNVIKRGQGYYMPYTIQNQSTQTVDVKVEVWITTDGKIDGFGDDIKLNHNGGPLYHLYTMNADGHIPGTTVNTSNSSTIEGRIWFEIPNNPTEFPNGLRTIGYHVSMPYLPAGSSDNDPDDNWVSLNSTHILTGN